MNIVVLHDQGSQSPRHDEIDAVIQARAVSAALQSLGHECTTVAATLDLDALAVALKKLEPDVVFNLVESLGGHGRLIHVIPGVLDALHIPYTGVPTEAQFNTSNKLVAKRMLRSAYLPTPAWHTIEDLQEAQEVQFDRYIIKSVWEHASVGLDEDSVIVAEAPWQLREAIENRLESLGGQGFVERFIDGREFNLALLADAGPIPQVLPPAEIVFEGYRGDKPKIIGYRAKWDADSFEYNHTPRRYDFPEEDSPLLDRLTSLALECWRLFGLRGYARVDFRVDELGRPWILEVNANPCLSPDAGFAAALSHAGLELRDAVERILQDALAHAHVDVARLHGGSR